MIFVAGASGTVGSELVKALSKRQIRFRVGHHQRPVGAPGAESVPFDYEKLDTIKSALAGAEAVFLLSGLVTPELKVVREAKAAGVKRLVKLSVWGAAEEAFSFAKWHRPVEREIEASGLRWTFLRPNGFMQNVVNFMGATIKAQGAFYAPEAEARISHVDARDIAEVAATVLTGAGHEGKAYTLSGPQALTYGEIADTLSRVLGRKISCVSISDDDYRKGAMGAGMPEVYADALVDLARYYREGGAARVTADVKAVTGREPIAFEQFARDHADRLR